MGIQQIASLVTLTCVAIIVLVGFFLTRQNKLELERKLRKWAVIVAVPSWIYMQLWYVVFAWDLADAAPLHVCDLGGLIAVVALWPSTKNSVSFRQNIFRAWLFFWGIGLTTSAFIVPVLTEEQGPSTMRFWLFWVSHGWVVGGAIYTFAILQYRPTRRDLFWILGIGLIWWTAMMIVNTAFHWNYGYLGPTNDPEEQSGAVIMLGDWPLRAILMGLIANGLLILLWLVGRMIPTQRSALS